MRCTFLFLPPLVVWELYVDLEALADPGLVLNLLLFIRRGLVRVTFQLTTRILKKLVGVQICFSPKYDLCLLSHRDANIYPHVGYLVSFIFAPFVHILPF
jgi:hypothetical protein